MPVNQRASCKGNSEKFHGNVGDPRVDRAAAIALTLNKKRVHPAIHGQ